MQSLLSARKRGFTLIELIIVVAIIAIIVAAVFVAMDPVKRLNASRNSTRRTDATAIAQALQLYVTDQQTAGAAISAAVQTIITNTSNWYMLGTAATGCNVACWTGVTPVAACSDLTASLVPSYIRGIPMDPSKANGKRMDGVTAQAWTAATTGYAVNYSNGAFRVRSCGAEGEGPGGVTTPAANLPDIEIAR